MAVGTKQAGGQTEAESLGRYRYEYPRPAVTVDVVVLRVVADRLDVLLIRRKHDPWQGRWALPGGFVEIDEPLEVAARRELAEETGLADVPVEQLGAFGDPDRDPRGRVITVAYTAVIRAGRDVRAVAGDDAADARWFDVDALPMLAADHGRILAFAVAQLRAAVASSMAAFGLVGETFTLPELRRVYEVVLARPVDKRNFRRKITGSGLIEPTGRVRREGAHRPAAEYRLVKRDEAEARVAVGDLALA